MRLNLPGLWRAWTRVAHRIGQAQTTAILWLIYFLVVPPFAAAARGARGRFGRSPGRDTAWRPAPARTPSVPSARRQA